MNDLLIIGGGAAGLTASIYASRYKLKHLIFGKIPGGQVVDAHVVQNYPGFVSINGPELVKRFVEHAQSYGVEIREEQITSFKKAATGFAAVTEKGEEYESQALILAMGARHRALNVPGEDRFLGKGVSYCATCDAPLFKDKVVAVVGGGDSAVTAALYLARYARTVYLVHRRQEFRAEPIWVERLQEEKKIELVVERQIEAIEGSQFVEKVILNEPYAGKDFLEVQGVFVEIGLIPAVSLASQIGVEVEKSGYIKIGPDMATNVSGVFAAGDIVHQPGGMPFRQIVTSAAQGALAAAGVYRYLKAKPPAPSWS